MVPGPGQAQERCVRAGLAGDHDHPEQRGVETFGALEIGHRADVAGRAAGSPASPGNTARTTSIGVVSAREAWGEFENAAPVERLDLEAELSRWSGVGTAGRIVPDAGNRTEQTTR
ncbi:MAG TPA: hypothetical protein VIC62_15665 [Nakamurella sp.]